MAEILRTRIELYAILDRAASGGRDLREVLDAVIAGGCRMVQLREKEWSTRQLLPLAQEVRRRAREAGVAFIVNDRLDAALAVEADGLHVGQDDLPAPIARRLLSPGMILGVSTHSLEQATHAQADGADYVAIGSIYPTATKPESQLVGVELIRRVRPLIRVPLVAIGGITPDNVGEVIRAGADGAAVISAVCGAPDPAAAARAFLARIKAAKAR
ncbi:MAG: thiamine phosphate synthase [Candidatus Rokubacteria bacterium]|nr:thiamine phosphate synthase [Candidatus Rokubacteria bacterium]